MIKDENKITLNSSITDLNLSPRAKNCLIRAGIHDINTLIFFRINTKRSLNEKNTLYSIHYIGKVVLKEIIDTVHENGFLFIDEENFYEMLQEKKEEIKNSMILELNQPIEEIDEITLGNNFNKTNQQNKMIQERLKRKHNLLIEYKKSILLMLQLLEKEEEIDLELIEKNRILYELNYILKSKTK